MTGPLVTLLVSLFDAAGLFQPTVYTTGVPYKVPDTSAADVVRIKSPYALVKHHSKVPNPPTELVGPYFYILASNRRGPSAKFAGQPMKTEWADVERTALSGDWLVSQDRQGRYGVFELTGTNANPVWLASLEDVNAHLAEHGLPPVSDSDFRTFEQWAEQRDRLRITRCLAVLSAASLGWLAVAGATLCLRRRAV